MAMQVLKAYKANLNKSSTYLDGFICSYFMNFFQRVYFVTQHNLGCLITCEQVNKYLFRGMNKNIDILNVLLNGFKVKKRDITPTSVDIVLTSLFSTQLVNVIHQKFYPSNRHMKINKPCVHFIIKIFLIENEYKTTPLGCLAFIFYQKNVL